MHAVCNGSGKPIALLLTEGQVNDYKGAAQLLHALPDAKELLADRGYDANWFRSALLDKEVTPCTSPLSKETENTLLYMIKRVLSLND